MADPRDTRGPGEEQPAYRVYRSRRSPFDRFRRKDEPPGLRDLERLRERRPEGFEPVRERGPGWRRVLKWTAIAAFAWIAFSYAVFLVSAQLTEGVSDEAEEALSSGGSLATGSTILVLGSDERPEGSLEPGAGGPGRADSILLLRVSLGQVRRLSILRDSLAGIPGHQPQKINAAYAIGGAPLMIETVEAFLGNGLEVNHVVEISFEDFPDMINALGGIDVTIDRCIRSQPFGDRVFRLRRGTHHLTGRQALAFARVRRNFCSPNEDDRARARRQQQVLEAIRSRFLSPSTFLRLPLVSWEAPRAIRTDLKGPGLTGLFSDLVIGGTGKTRVLEPSGAGPGGSLIVSEQEKAEAVDRLVD